MGAQSPSSRTSQSDSLAGFAIAVIRENGTWRCEILRPIVLTSLTKAESALRELRSSGAVFGLFDVDEEFFVLLRPGPAGTRILLSDATAALDYTIADEILDRLDIDASVDELENSNPFEEGDLALLADLGLSDAVLGLILDDSELDIGEQLLRISAEMGFESEFKHALWQIWKNR